MSDSKLELEARLRQLFTNLGIEIAPEKELIEAKETCQYIGVRVSDMADPTPGSKPYPCAHCAEPTWFAPSGQAIIEGRKLLGNVTKTVCTVCFGNRHVHS